MSTHPKVLNDITDECFDEISKYLISGWNHTTPQGSEALKNIIKQHLQNYSNQEIEEYQRIHYWPLA